MNKILTSMFSMLITWMVCCTGFAQDGPPPVGASDREPTIFELSESLPRVIYSLDEEGNPTVKWVDSFPWTKANQLEQMLRGKTDPKFVITELELDGRIEGEHANLVTRLRLKTLADGQQIIPIKMGSVHFSTQPKSSRGPVLAQFNEKFREYELLVDGKQDEDQLVEFESRVPLKKIGNETHLVLAVPRVPVSSLRIWVPETEIEATANQGTSVERISTDEGTQLRLDGVPAELDLMWFPSARRPASEKPTIEVQGSIEVEVDALGGITADAALVMNSFAQPIERVTVVIPEQTRFAEGNAEFGGYRVVPAELNSRELHVIFDEPSPQPPVVRVRVRAEKELAKFELAGFEVKGAFNQFGEVVVYSQETRLLNWSAGEFARRIPNRESNRRAKATFEYSRPNQIQLSIARQTAELIVEPFYIVSMEDTRARLTAIFQCSKRSGSPSHLRIDMGPWRFQGLGPDPDNVIRDLDQVALDDGSVELPLVDPPDRFEVTITAMLTLEEGLATPANLPSASAGTRIDLAFPKPRDVSSMLQSTVALSPLANISIVPVVSPDYVEVRVPNRIAVELEPDSNPNCFRMRSVGPPGVLSIVASKLERSTQITSTVELLDVTPTHLRVQQRMQWRVSDVALPSALLTMDERIFNESNLQVSLDGKSVISSRTPTFGDSLYETVTVQVPLESQMSTFEIAVTYDWKLPEAAAGEPVTPRFLDAVELDLVMPKRSTSTAIPTTVQNMEVRTRFLRPRIPGFEVALSYNRDAWPWTSYVATSATVEAEVDPEFAAAPATLPLTIKQVEEDAAVTDFEELVDRAWFQTWYTHSMRTDRAVFRLNGGSAQLRIKMPSDLDFRKLNVFLDGQIKEYRRDGDSAIELEVDASASSHVVELQYSRDTREPPGILETHLPQIENANISCQWYWHIVMPRDECLITWPRNLTRAHRWDWSELLPRQQPQLTLDQLEDWIGATRTGAQVLVGSNQYLFGAMGETERLSVRTVPLSLYALTVSGGIFVFGLMFLYSQRRILLLSTLTTVVLGLIFLHPSYAAVAGQFAVMGLLLVGLTGFLARLLGQTSRSMSNVSPTVVTQIAGRTQGSGSSVDGLGTTMLTRGSSQLRNEAS